MGRSAVHQQPGQEHGGKREQEDDAFLAAPHPQVARAGDDPGSEAEQHEHARLCRPRALHGGRFHRHIPSIITQGPADRGRSGGEVHGTHQAIRARQMPRRATIGRKSTPPRHRVEARNRPAPRCLDARGPPVPCPPSLPSEPPRARGRMRVVSAGSFPTATDPRGQRRRCPGDIEAGAPRADRQLHSREMKRPLRSLMADRGVRPHTPARRCQPTSRPA